MVRENSVTPMLMGAGMLAKPSRLLSAAGEQARKAKEDETDNTKYGKYILLSQKNEGDDHGIPVVNTMGMSGITKVIPGCPKVLIGRFPPPGPMPGHEVPEKHSIQEFLIHLGNDPDDPFDLGAEIELYMGEEKEKHTFNKSAIVYVPPEVVHGPLIVKSARKPFNFLEIVVGPELPGAVYG